MTQQAISLGFLPRMNVVHTEGREIGQIYVPFVNWALAAARSPPSSASVRRTRWPARSASRCRC